MLFIDYTTAVLRDYKIKRGTSEFSARLNNPSPAELRDECEAALDKRYEVEDVRDARILKTFFGDFNNKREALELIKNHPIDRFRPLVKFFKGGIKEPVKKNIDLIAWLIDFHPRPFGHQNTPKGPGKGIYVPTGPGTDGPIPPPKPVPPPAIGPSHFKKRLKQFAVPTFIAGVIGTTFWAGEQSRNNISGNSHVGVTENARLERVYRRGPRGGCYYISESGSRVYVDRSQCN